MDNGVIVCCKCKHELSSKYYFRTIRHRNSYYCESCLKNKFSRRYKYMDSEAVKKLMEAHYTLVSN